jgi:hypothetical protein
MRFEVYKAREVHGFMRFTRFAGVLIALCGSVALLAQETKGYDELLDLYVRDGEVYYRALKSDRGRLDGFIGQLARASVEGMSRDERAAFWINAYNAIVLRTVVDHYPIAGKAGAYPQKSIRQIPGAFERLPHQVAGRTVTLDQIEQTILPEFNDPRIYLALGRGAEGGGRLRSEAYTAAKLEAQLAEAAAECVSRQQCIAVDRQADTVVISPLFSWREKEFAAAYAEKAPKIFASRSPIERAVLAFAQPKLLTTEKEHLEKNTFRVEFGQFDWKLNDLTGRGGR